MGKATKGVDSNVPGRTAQRASDTCAEDVTGTAEMKAMISILMLQDDC